MAAAAASVAMAEWIFDAAGCASVILDDYCLRNMGGRVVAWHFCGAVYALHGVHIGWFAQGNLVDGHRTTIGTLASATQAAAFVGPRAAVPIMPAFARRPHTPQLNLGDGRPGAIDGRSCTPDRYLTLCNELAPPARRDGAADRRRRASLT